MVNGKEIPNKMIKSDNVPASKGHIGAVVDSNIEGRGAEMDSIRSGTRPNKKSASHVGNTNVSHS